MMEKEKSTQVARLKKFQEETINNVLAKVKEFQEIGALELPRDYSPANALKSAWFVLLNTQDKYKKPVLETCSNVSVVNSLMDMVVQGLNPAKKQCAFIAYGNQLTCTREYFGNIALAKRYNPDIYYITANVIYQDDEFQYEVNPTTGRRTVIKHGQKLENIDINKIRGAYATVVFTNGKSDMEPMSIEQIKKAWDQGSMKGKSGAHTNFTDEMCKKTVINRLCKRYINSSDDSVITPLSNTPVNSQGVPEDQANKNIIDIDETQAQDLPEDQPQEEVGATEYKKPTENLFSEPDF